MSTARAKPASVIAVAFAGMMVLTVPAVPGLALGPIAEKSASPAHTVSPTITPSRPDETVNNTTTTSRGKLANGASKSDRVENKNIETLRALATPPMNMHRGGALFNITATPVTNGQSGNLTMALRLATEGSKLQTGQLNWSDQPRDPTDMTLTPTPTPEHDSPSVAAFAILDRYNVTPTAYEAANIRSLDHLPEPTRSKLTAVLDAYLGYFISTRETYADANQSHLYALANASDAELQEPRNGSLGTTGDDPSSMSALSEEKFSSNGAESLPLDSPATLEAAGVNVPQLLAARLRLLEAMVELHEAFGQSDASGYASPSSHETIDEGVQVEDDDVGGVLSINLSTHNNTYEDDYALLLDRGGDDTYNNNAGGTSKRLRSTPRAAALGDFGGNDSYKGRNGGGVLGTGFLLDMGSNSDTYNATGGGSNGGGGAGLGFLMDAGGDDAYNAPGGGTNGGGVTGGKGFLLDAGGNDKYFATDFGTNGGGWQGGMGTLIDVAGHDTYTAGSGGVNGGVQNDVRGVNQPVPAVGLLVDAGGNDKYTEESGSCSDASTDCSQIPKGNIGAQIDVAATDAIPDTVPDPDPDLAATTPAYSADLCVEGMRDTCDGDGSVGQLEDNDSDAVFGTIEKALKTTNQSFETIEVRPETYHESLTVSTSNLTLVANASAAPGEVVLDGGAGTGDPREDLSHGVEVRATNVTFDGFVVQNYTMDEIAVTSGANRTRVKETTVRGSIAVTEANATAIRANRIDQNDRAGPTITVASTPAPSIVNNTVTGARIAVTQSDNATIRSNSIEDITAGENDSPVGGSGLAGSQSPTATDSKQGFAGTRPFGITVTGGRNVTLTDNSIRSLSESGEQAGPVGIAVLASNLANVTNNSVTDLTETGRGAGPVGITVAEGSTPTLTDNSVDFLDERGPGNGPVGVRLAADSLAVPVTQNEVTNTDAEGGGKGPVALKIVNSTLNSSVKPFGDNTFDGAGNVAIANSLVAGVVDITFAVNVTLSNSTVTATDNTFEGRLAVSANSTLSATENTFWANLTVTNSTVRILDNTLNGGWIHLQHTTGGTIAKNNLRKGGITVRHSQDATIHDNSVAHLSGSGNQEKSKIMGIQQPILKSWVPADPVVGITVQASSNTTVSENAISDLYVNIGDGPIGVSVNGSTGTTVVNNTVEDLNEEAEVCTFCFEPNVNGRGPIGVLVTDATNTIVAYNAIRSLSEVDSDVDNYGGDGSVGIEVRNDTRTTITSNMIADLTADDKGGPPVGINLVKTTNSDVLGNNLTGVLARSVAADTNTPETVRITHNRFNSNATYGVYNEGSGVINATYNHWGALTGPSSPDPDRPLSDPIAAIPATGGGTAVSEGSVPNFSNVHFAPWRAVPGGGAVGGGGVGGGNGSVGSGTILVEGECDTVDRDDRKVPAEDVDGDIVYGTIQGAIDAAEPDAEIKILECTYPANATVDTTALTLTGIQNAVLDGGGTKARGLVINASGVTVRGVTVRGYTSAGIALVGANATLANNTLRANANGTAVYGTGAPRLEANWFHDNSYAGLVFASNATVGDDTVYHNRFEDNAAYGVYNANNNAVVNATYNHWGAFDAPSSPNGSGTPLADPDTGKRANGSGDAVSEGGTPGVANVHFDPYNVVHYRWDVDHLVDDDGGDCEASYESIEAAINDSSGGETIVVCSGTYAEEERYVSFGTKITLRGSRYANKPTIAATIKPLRGGDAAGSTIRRFTITKPAGYCDDTTPRSAPHEPSLDEDEEESQDGRPPIKSCDGVLLQVNNFTVAENVITGNRAGIHRVEDLSVKWNLIVNNTIRGNRYGYFCEFPKETACGDYHPPKKAPVLRDNLIINNEYYGIYRHKPGSEDDEWILAVGNTWACGGPSGGYRDPKTGKPADGSGDRITQNTRFDPFEEVQKGPVTSNGDSVACEPGSPSGPSTGPPDLGGNRSDPRVTELSVREVETSDPDAEFNVDWRVEDSDGNLREVELTLIDETTGGNNEQHMEKNVEGESADRVTRMVAATDDTRGHNYTVKLVVRDEAGNTSRATRTITETEPKDTPTASWPSEETETPGDDSSDGGTGPGSGPGTGPGTGGSGGTNGTSTAGSGGVSTAEATADGESQSTVQRTAESTDTRTSTASTPPPSTPPPSTPTLTQTPPVTPTPEVIPGFGVGAWVFGFVLLVGLLAARRRD